MKEYKKFLENKIVVAKSYGTTELISPISEVLMPHQRDIVEWALMGGRRAIFASFGLGKTMMQLEIGRKVMELTGKPFLVVMPLGVIGEFKDDIKILDINMEVVYIKESDVIEEYNPRIIYCTNYERIRKGDVAAEVFGGVSFDEASILRNMKTETTNYVLKHFKSINYRFVATATPTPNDFIEILNYADYLGVIDRGHALTRFFQRDSTKAGNLKLYENKKEEFWRWVSTWAVFINKPSDLGYDDEGYNLPKMNIIEHRVDNAPDGVIYNKEGDMVLFKGTSKGLLETAREKRSSIDVRVAKALEIVSGQKDDNWILWHHLENERKAIEKEFKEYDLKSVFGSQKNEQKEDLLIAFKRSKYKILSTKPQIAGSGCNFQRACNNQVFVGLNYKFNDFIQAVHRIYRFKQDKEVNVHVIYTENEDHVWKTIQEKWRKHIELQTEMINIVREYGLNTEKIKTDMKRQMFEKPRKAKIGRATLYNDDTVKVHEDMEDNSVDMVLTSIPFGDHYEYSDNYNDMGHNDGNEEFFKQMDFLTPNLLRTLKPGRIAAVHVKDRIRYSYQNGTKFTTISDFSADTSKHFQKHGFYLMGKITVTTDVVRENNQTYRLGYTEQCKDATKMGVGLPEYILLFRKAPSHMDNAYADEPVSKTKEEYKLGNWQLDAHSLWKSDGNRFLSSEEIKKMDVKSICAHWKKHNLEEVYNFKEHLQACEDLASFGKLSSLFMTLPNHSKSDFVWTDINRMNTLNTNQANRKKQKHICPLQLDIIERLINRFSSKDDVINDPFGGLFSTAYKALEMNRQAISAELNPDYYNDGLYYMKAIEYKINVPTLFDLH